MFLKVPVIIIIRFGENNVLCPKYINIYEFRGGTGGRTSSTVHNAFIIKKNRKVEEHDLYLNQILHHFDLTIVLLGLIINILQRGGPNPISLQSENSSSN